MSHKVVAKQRVQTCWLFSATDSCPQFVTNNRRVDAPDHRLSHHREQPCLVDRGSTCTGKLGNIPLDLDVQALSSRGPSFTRMSQERLLVVTILHATVQKATYAMKVYGRGLRHRLPSVATTLGPHKAGLALAALTRKMPSTSESCSPT